MSRKVKLVYGVGVNDADYHVQIFQTVSGKRKLIWFCPFYRAWKDMLGRCYSPKLLARFPTYLGCSVVPEWLTFSVFRLWMIDQSWHGNQLDKDILKQGNKVYGPSTCVFVSSQLNNFMIDSGSSRGEWPIGVHWHKRVGKFAAQCKNPFSGETGYLGYFKNPYDAHEAWRKRKHELACMHAEMQTDPRIAEALRTRYLA